MEILSFFKKKIIVFVLFAGAGFILFSNIGKAGARENAFIACLIDDDAVMYKTQIIYSGMEIEYSRITNFSDSSMIQSDNPLPIKDITSYGGKDHNYSLDIEKTDTMGTAEYNIDDKGMITITYNGKDGREISSEEWAKMYNTASSNLKEELTIPDNLPDTSFSDTITNMAEDMAGDRDKENNAKMTRRGLSLTFPADVSYSASESDVNRAYSVADLIGENWRDALLYINDGKSFTSVETLIETAYALVTTDKGIIVNQYGKEYAVEYTNNSMDGDEYGYTALCHISRLNADSSDLDKEMDFVFAVKKGYRDCESKDFFEDGTSNNLSKEKSSTADTVYITWQQLFLEAGIFYAQGVTYSNQADLYEIADFEKSLISTFRNFLSGIQNKLQLYTIEDCIFNNSIRGSQAFVYGIYQLNYHGPIFSFFIIMTAISLCFVTISIISMIMRKQWAVASPTSRYSMMNGLKNIILSVFIISGLWLLMRFAFVINFKFVHIWEEYLNGKVMRSTGGYNSLSAILYAFVFFIIRTYVNIVYILRGLIVPILMIISPVCVFVFSIGEAGKKVTFAWLKEFVGNVYIQSFHALVYGFILANSNGLRGIEALCVYASILPATSVIRQITGLGGGELLKKGSALTSAVGSTIGAGVSAGAQIEGARIQAEAQKNASWTSANYNMGGTVAGGLLGIAGGLPGIALGASLGGAVGGGIGGMKGASILAEGTKEASKVTAGGGLFQAGMGMAMNTVLDTGDNGATSQGLGTAGRSVAEIHQAEGRRAQQQAEATSNMFSGVARALLFSNRMGYNQGTRMTDKYDNSVGINGLSEPFANSSLPAYVTSRGSVANEDGTFSNSVTMTYNKDTKLKGSDVTQALRTDKEEGGTRNYDNLCKEHGANNVFAKSLKDKFSRDIVLDRYGLENAQAKDGNITAVFKNPVTPKTIVPQAVDEKPLDNAPTPNEMSSASNETMDKMGMNGKTGDKTQA